MIIYEELIFNNLQKGFNSPENALMNVLNTPALEATDIISSDDYKNNMNRLNINFAQDSGENFKLNNGVS